MNKKTHPSGFSLMELAVGIAVCLILVVLALPVISRQAEGARAAACVVKMRHLAVVMTLFRSERQQKLWDLRSTAEGGEGGIPPAHALYRYGVIENAAALLCPSATNAATGAWKTGGTGSPAYVAAVANQFVSYAVNGMGFYQGTPWKMTHTPITHYAHFQGRESLLPLFMDGRVFQLNATSWQPDMRFSRLVLRHQGRCNVVFLDGHVESLDHDGVMRLDPYGGTNPAWLRDFGPAAD